MNGIGFGFYGSPQIETALKKALPEGWRTHSGFHQPIGKIFGSYRTPQEFHDMSFRVVDNIVHGNSHRYAPDSIDDPHIFEKYARYVRKRWKPSMEKLGDLGKLDIYNSALVGRGASRILILEFSARNRRSKTNHSHLVISLHRTANQHLGQIEAALRKHHPSSRIIISRARSDPPVKNPDI